MADDTYARIADLAMIMARSRRMRLDANRYLNGPWKGTDPAARTGSKIKQARHELTVARIAWRKASAAMWHLAAKIERGEA